MFRKKEKEWSAICSEVARILKKERESRGFSKSIMAERTGLSRAMIGYVESEARNPTLQTLLRMADALEVDLTDVIEQAQKRKNKSERKDID